MPNKKSYINIKKCRLCDSVFLNSFINFDNVALGNNLQSNFKKAAIMTGQGRQVLLPLWQLVSCFNFQI